MTIYIFVPLRAFGAYDWRVIILRASSWIYFCLKLVKVKNCSVSFPFGICDSNFALNLSDKYKCVSFKIICLKFNFVCFDVTFYTYCNIAHSKTPPPHTHTRTAQPSQTCAHFWLCLYILLFNKIYLIQRKACDKT